MTWTVRIDERRWRGDGVPDVRRMPGGAGIHPPRRVLIPGTRRAVPHSLSMRAVEIRRLMEKNGEAP